MVGVGGEGAHARANLRPPAEINSLSVQHQESVYQRRARLAETVMMLTLELQDV